MNPTLIHQAFTEKTSSFNGELKDAVLSTLSALDEGKIRVCEKKEGKWQAKEWIKEAILLYFRMEKMKPFQSGDFNFFDKVPVKKWTGKEGVRVVPQALVRKGAFVATKAILMPSYINIGAFVGEGTLIDTWATVGSCAQVGAGVHVSGGVGLGGVLEPVQARPVIIEDHVFLGSRSIIVEGVCVKEGAVIGAGTVITASTRILDVSGTEVQTLQGEIPENSVVIPGSRSKKFPAGVFQVPCALIIGKRSASTNKKTSLNDCLREFNVPV